MQNAYNVFEFDKVGSVMIEVMAIKTNILKQEAFRGELDLQSEPFLKSLCQWCLRWEVPHPPRDHLQVWLYSFMEQPLQNPKIPDDLNPALHILFEHPVELRGVSCYRIQL